MTPHNDYDDDWIARERLPSGRSVAPPLRRGSNRRTTAINFLDRFDAVFAGIVIVWALLVLLT
jgi:hypothetical protein